MKRLADSLKNTVDDLANDQDDDYEEIEEDQSEESDNHMEAILKSFNVNDFADSRSGYSKIEVAVSNLNLYVRNLELSESSADVGKFWNGRLEAEPLLSKLALERLSFPGRRLVNLSKLAQSKYFGRQSIKDISNALFLGSLSNNFWNNAPM